MVPLQAVSKRLSSRAWLERGPRDFHWIRARGSGTGHREMSVCCVFTVTPSRDRGTLGSPSADRVNAAELPAALTEGVDLQNSGAEHWGRKGVRQRQDFEVITQHTNCLQVCRGQRGHSVLPRRAGGAWRGGIALQKLGENPPSFHLAHLSFFGLICVPGLLSLLVCLVSCCLRHSAGAHAICLAC